MAIDQYGQTFHNLGEHPRKALCDRLGKQHVSKMYVDGNDGKTYQTGYVIGGHWLTICNVEPWRIPA